MGRSFDFAQDDMGESITPLIPFNMTGFSCTGLIPDGVTGAGVRCARLGGVTGAGVRCVRWRGVTSFLCLVRLEINGKNAGKKTGGFFTHTFEEIFRV